MSAWQVKEVDELPAIENRESFRMYKLPDGSIWVPNTIYQSETPTHWINYDEYLNDVENELEKDQTK